MDQRDPEDEEDDGFDADDEDDFELDEDGEDDEDGSDLFEVTRDPRTVCQLCGGAGFVANPNLAIIAGTPRTIDNGRCCPHCDSNRTFTGMVPPL